VKVARVDREMRQVELVLVHATQPTAPRRRKGRPPSDRRPPLRGSHTGRPGRR
jgi:hypothetical protein